MTNSRVGVSDLEQSTGYRRLFVPDGRTNEIRVAIESVSVTADDNGFTAEVSGQFYSEILDTDSETTPETPLPMGRGPVGATYTVTERALVRDGVVVECW